jgi:Tfp pilus assembly protein PilO
MASQLSAIGRLPVWQAAAVSVVVMGLMTAGWYTTYYEEAAKNLETAKGKLDAAEQELERMQKKLENYEQEMRELAAAEEEIQQIIRNLPKGIEGVDHLMKPFQQQARLVGFDVRSWAPGGEQKFDYYAKTPIEIHAEGSWHQAAEFFRKISEMDQVVNIEEVRMNTLNRKKKGEGEAAGELRLKVDFTVATFRFLEIERVASSSGSRRAEAKEEAAPAAGGAEPAKGAAPAPAAGGGH